ncbi:DegV family protein with EDD domain [Streptosporangium becharense]|uniref:DegV family protein with EDD domain n=1 Tax=Streptosporangium becharense TaxID=1816182 RepID=A0A7W9MFE9_9ACTN|nr:DegV family protein [Streptosporangium becharense]MBB2912178.1 DegV family protein with EDD domain [Streptosporangium becharense]MBB5818725.1 DegV family protein with EDD domain [Streptosporangium becharense]
MSPSVTVVTDSTAYLPQEEVSRLGIVVVPLQVIVGGRPFDDVVPLDGVARGDSAARSRGGSRADGRGVMEALGERGPVTTSRPAPRRFADAYAEAAARGATGVVSVHLSAEMSGTVEAARIGAADSPVPVEVVDSRSIAMGLGFPVLAAAEAAAAGATRTEVADAARRCMESVRSFFYVDTLEYLRRGGRIGAAATLLGSALMMKPLLHISGGVVVPLEKVRTAGRAIARLEDLTAEAAGAAPVRVAVQHLRAEARAEALAARLPRRIPGLTRVTVVEVGAVVGAHTGPGMLGLTVSPATF